MKSKNQQQKKKNNKKAKAVVTNSKGSEQLGIKIDKTKFKTEMCKNWIEQGFCRYGTKCQFAHGTQEVVVKNDPIHDKYKSKMCKTFQEKAYCPYGKRCQFRHEDRTITELKSYHNVYKLTSLEQMYTTGTSKCY